MARGRGLRIVGALVLVFVAIARRSLAMPGAPAGESAGDQFSGDFAPLSLMQVVNPADKAERPEGARPETAPSKSEHVGTWELPAVRVVGEKPGELREEDRIGAYEQPRWTADRRFTGT